MIRHVRLLGLTPLLLFVPAKFQSAQITIRDELKRTVTLPSAATRIVSLAPSITETLFAIGAGDAVAGVTDFCNYPEGANSKTRVGGVINPSVETIVSLNPDLIILSMEGNLAEDFAVLETLGVPAFVTNPRTLQGIHASIADLGELTGRVNEAAVLIRTMRSREDSVISLARTRKKKGTLLFVSVQPLIVVGRGTFLNELMELAGAVNLASSSPMTYPAISREAVIAADPEIILMMSGFLSDPENLMKIFPEWQGLSAMRENNVFTIDQDIASRPGPRAVDVLEILFDILHTQAK
jgi:iron complex transport system substrate-binding protein